MDSAIYTRLDRKHDKALLNCLFAPNKRRASYWGGQVTRYARQLKRAGRFNSTL